MSTISRLDVRLLRVPLTRPWAADVTSVGVIATRVVRSDGAEGWGFSWTPQIGAEAVHALIAHDIAAAAIGRPAAPGEAWQGLWEHLHEAGVRPAGATELGRGADGIVCEVLDHPELVVKEMNHPFKLGRNRVALELRILHAVLEATAGRGATRVSPIRCSMPRAGRGEPTASAGGTDSRSPSTCSPSGVATMRSSSSSRPISPSEGSP